MRNSALAGVHERNRREEASATRREEGSQVSPPRAAAPVRLFKVVLAYSSQGAAARGTRQQLEAGKGGFACHDQATVMLETRKVGAPSEP